MTRLCLTETWYTSARLYHPILCPDVLSGSPIHSSVMEPRCPLPPGMVASGTSLVAQMVKASACNAEDQGLIPGLGRSLREENGNPLQYSCLENPKGGGAW